eukprot:scpid80773/ scgid25538/ 
MTCVNSAKRSIPLPHSPRITPCTTNTSGTASSTQIGEPWPYWTETCRGRPKLIYNGYAYTQHRTTCGHVTHWQCVRLRTAGCRGRLRSRRDTVLTTPQGVVAAHNHAAEYNALGEANHLSETCHSRTGKLPKDSCWQQHQVTAGHRVPELSPQGKKTFALPVTTHDDRLGHGQQAIAMHPTSSFPSMILTPTNAGQSPRTKLPSRCPSQSDHADVVCKQPRDYRRHRFDRNPVPSQTLSVAAITKGHVSTARSNRLQPALMPTSPRLEPAECETYSNQTVGGYTEHTDEMFGCVVRYRRSIPDERSQPTYDTRKRAVHQAIEGYDDMPALVPISSCH